MRKAVYFLSGMLTVWGSHASELEKGFNTIQLINVIIASILGGLIALRALMDLKK